MNETTDVIDSAADAAEDPTDAASVAARYVAQWLEPDGATRRRMIEELWAPDATHVIETPPEAVRDAAATLGLPAPPLRAQGHDALERRVGRGHDEFVAPGEFTFRLGPVAWGHAEIVVLTWEMVAVADGTVVGTGRDVLILDPDGRIRSDHQYVG